MAGNTRNEGRPNQSKKEREIVQTSKTCPCDKPAGRQPLAIRMRR